jgi:transglutaminase-like putative cysteine protease
VKVMTRIGIPVLAAAAVGCSGFMGSDEPKASLVIRDGAKTRKGEFVYVAGVKEIPAGAKRLDVWIPLPQSSAAQIVGEPRIVAPVDVAVATEPVAGNRMAHFRFEGANLAPFEIRATFDVEIAERKDDRLGSMYQDPPTARDRLGDRLAPLDGEAVEIARTVAGDEQDPVTIGEKLYREVLNRMRYSKEGEGWGKGSTDWACTAGYGNCTDFHALFMTMARSRGIPARFTMGFPLADERGDAEVKGYHCWAEFFVEGIGWIPVDASEADKALDAGKPEVADYYFGSLTENRVAFTRGRDIDLVPRQSGEPLNFFIYPYAEIDGKPFAGVQKSFRFTDR